MLGTEKIWTVIGSFCILDLSTLDISGEFCVLIGRLFLAGQVGVSCPLVRFVNARKYLVQACGPFQYPPNLISRLVNIAYLLYISFFKSVTSLCHSLCCCINPLSPNGDQHQFSPNHVHRLSRDLVMRITKLIT